MVSMIITTKGADPSIKNIMKDFSYMVDSIIEDKFDVRKEVSLLVTYMDINDCDSTIYLEQSKRCSKLWVANSDVTYRFSILNYASVYDMSTVNNYHKNSGHVLIFSADFDEDENLKSFKKTAETAFKCKENASIEKAISFFYIKGRICIRVYLVKDGSEIGPRLDLELDRIFEGCFKGKRLYGKAKTVEAVEAEETQE